MWAREQWHDRDYQDLKEHLETLAEPEYKTFHSRLLPNIDGGLPLLGVRLPLLKSISKDIAKGNPWDFLARARSDYYEEVMLQGLTIGKLSGPLPEILEAITQFLPKIDNWAVCDCFVSGLKVIKKHPQAFYAFIHEYLHSSEEYELRFAIVVLLGYYMEAAYIDDVLQILDGISHEGYYVKMAVAWALSVAFVKEREKTLAYLQVATLPNWTYNKALQKIIESNRVTASDKAIMRQMKRR